MKNIFLKKNNFFQKTKKGDPFPAAHKKSQYGFGVKYRLFQNEKFYDRAQESPGIFKNIYSSAFCLTDCFYFMLLVKKQNAALPPQKV